MKLVMDTGDAASIEDAEKLLSRYAVRVHFGRAGARSRAMQAALLTVIVTGRRALPGGVFIEGDFDVPLSVPFAGYATLGEAAKALGARAGEAEDYSLPLIVFGEGLPLCAKAPIAVRCLTAGWRGGVVPADSDHKLLPGDDIALAGILAGALAVSEVFQHLRGGFAQAGRRGIGQSLWAPDATNWLAEITGEPALEFLPNDLWLIGLGHLGQAYLWSLGFLPYVDRADLRLFLQDFDTLDVANESTSVLTNQTMRHQSKTRAMAHWAERQGFRTALIERVFGENIKVQDHEPAVALCGVDNPSARSALEDAGFSWVIDAGLGAGVSEYLNMRLYSFPGPRLAKEIWGKARRHPRVLPLDKPAYKALKDAGLDECGLTLLAERTVGAPFVGVVAATQVIGEVLRCLHGGRPVLAMDATLRSFDDRIVVMGEAGSRPNLGFSQAARGKA
ncbi:MAG TPA: hypothetical protein VNM24_06990 [Burkholderiales bacterium]|nr:hypothetical protein [Burkholderiales bacterium]